LREDRPVLVRGDDRLRRGQLRRDSRFVLALDRRLQLGQRLQPLARWLELPLALVLVLALLRLIGLRNRRRRWRRRVVATTILGNSRRGGENGGGEGRSAGKTNTTT